MNLLNDYLHNLSHDEFDYYDSDNDEHDYDDYYESDNDSISDDEFD